MASEPVHELPAISKKLGDSVGLVVAQIENSSEELLQHSMQGKWTMLENLDHLVKSTQPLNKLLAKPKVSLRLLFGKPNRPGRDYDQLVQRYREKLAMAGDTPSPFVPMEGEPLKMELLLFSLC